MAVTKYIGIQRLWYANPLTAALTAATLPGIINGAKEISNSHQDTFQYSQDDPAVDEYENELNGEIYFVDKKNNGKEQITFVMGEWEYADRAALQGGKVIQTTDSVKKDIGWEPDDNTAMVYKTIIALTKTGNYIVFSNASIVAKTTMANKNMGLGITATATSNPNAGVKSRYMFEGSAVQLKA